MNRNEKIKEILSGGCQMIDTLRGAASEEVIEIVISNKKYRITKEGTRSDLYDFGAWYTKISGYLSGPAWRLERRTFPWGWLRKSTTNDPGIVLRWKKEYFNDKKDE